MILYVCMKINIPQLQNIYYKLRKICQNMGFLWPIFSCIRTESTAFFRRLITKAEFKNPSSTSIAMKWKTDVRML